MFGSWALGLALALLLNQDIPARGFFRVALLLPWIIPSIVSIVSWRWLISDQTGLVNVALGAFGIRPIYFLSTGRLATFSVIVVKIWRSFPFMMLSLLAALQTINHESYEVASIDGAGSWQSFRFITLPQLMPISIVLWILMTIWSVNDFETPWLLTQGGPSQRDRKSERAGLPLHLQSQQCRHRRGDRVLHHAGLDDLRDHIAAPPTRTVILEFGFRILDQETP